MNWQENKKIKEAWKLLAVAVIKRAVIDLGEDYLNSENADFFKAISETENCDYQKQVERHKKKMERAEYLYSKNKYIPASFGEYIRKQAITNYKKNKENYKKSVDIEV